VETKSRARETEGEEVRRQVCGREERRAVGAGSARVRETGRFTLVLLGSGFRQPLPRAACAKLTRRGVHRASVEKEKKGRKRENALLLNVELS